MAPRCPECGTTTDWLAPECRECGARSPARRNLFAALAAFLFLLLAVVVVVLVATRKRPPIEASAPVEQLSSPPTTTTTAPADFAWLEQSMKACDEQAAKDTGTLHFLVIPLAADPKTTRDWRWVSITDIGNASVLPGDKALEGLRQLSLMISNEEYAFSVRDETTKALHKWDAGTGVQWLRTADLGAITSYRIQIKPRGFGSDSSWGNVIERVSGNCNWISPLLQP
jgi:hypothetical protein